MFVTYERFDVLLSQRIEKSIVIANAVWVYVIITTRWQNTGPGERKPVEVNAEIRQSINVLLISVVGICSHVSISTVCYQFWSSVS